MAEVLTQMVTDNKIYHNAETDTFYFSCPHCNSTCEVPRIEIRCTIFRHAVFKEGLNFVPPHASKDECERWLERGLVFGCAKPFRFNGKTVEKCGYI